MKLLPVLAFVVAFAGVVQAACPAGLTTANATISTNDVILIKSPLLTYSEALSACQCFGDTWQLGNSTAIFDYHRSSYNRSVKANSDLRDLLLANFAAPVKAWFGYQYADPNSPTGICPAFEVDPGYTATGLSPCADKYAAICARSKLVYNSIGSACDNNLQLCAPGGYCNGGTCAVDTICYPTNPCQAGLATGYSSNKLDAYCTVTPGAPGGYTCECGAIQAVTTGPGPQTCVECPSANPCALIQCAAGSSCAFTCGDPRGVHCEAPGGAVVPPVTRSPSTTVSPTVPATTSTPGTGNACQTNPCGLGGVCSPNPSGAYPYTCICSNGFVTNGGTCIPRPVEPYQTKF